MTTRRHSQIAQAMVADQHRLARQLRHLHQSEQHGEETGERIAQWERRLQASIARRQARAAALPRWTYDDQLPICGKRAEIAAALVQHPVIVVCGETGSGKSTQLPKICLEAGRGIAGIIGHTQPRRIAARGVATRIAEELSCPLGAQVGYKIRFTDETGPNTLIKVMTDGILLAETQQDRFLNQYDTLIIDEAHERSLNIDFLLGYVQRLLAKRRNLKLIITSATIDAARFAEHFASPEGPAPVVHVSGRVYPVEVRYRPPIAEDDRDEADLEQLLKQGLDELCSEGAGDILVFLPTERDILETAETLRGRSWPGDPGGKATEILPLFGRLSEADQQRIFQPHNSRRIVLATNVAESSLTVPGIRFVIDLGLARISRYAPRSKVQRLPIEPISRASADQRKGRCGRIGPGICLRLYSKDDYERREEFTPPEIQRTNLASVVLRALYLGLGNLADFPFLDPPRAAVIRDGEKTLFEIGALDDQGELTAIGRRLAQLPVDPRIARIIFAGEEEGCLAETLVIASALELQDPRDRPLDKQQQADASHAQFADPDSDFLSYLKLWEFCKGLQAKLSRNQFRRACRQNFLSFHRVHEWFEIHRQLRDLVAGRKHPLRGIRDEIPARDADRSAKIHRALLRGLLSGVALRSELGDYTVAGGMKAFMWPGSGTMESKPRWIMAEEVVETSRRFVRTVARIQPEWLESIAAHLIQTEYSEPFWDQESATPFAWEKVSLFGLPIIPRRRVRLAKFDPALSRQMFIENGLVAREYRAEAPFVVHNQKLLEQAQTLEAKLRQRGLLKDESQQLQFFDRVLPELVVDGRSFDRWRKQAEQENPRCLFWQWSDLVKDPKAQDMARQFPDRLELAGLQLPIEYRFNPGTDADGMTLVVPRAALSRLDSQRLAWLVPGFLEEKVTALIKSLPKALRTRFVPVPQTANLIAQQIPFGQGSLLAAIARGLTALSGAAVPLDEFQEEKLPAHLRFRIHVVDQDGKTLAADRDLRSVRNQLGESTAEKPYAVATTDVKWHKDGITRWDFGELPREVSWRQGGMEWKGHPGLVDEQRHVCLRLLASPEVQRKMHRTGVRLLFAQTCKGDLRQQIEYLDDWNRLKLWGARLADSKRLREEAELLLADRACFSVAGELPRNGDEFQALCMLAKRRIPLASQEVRKLLTGLLQEYHEASLLCEKTTAAQFRRAAEDVRGQLNALTASGFLSQTPWEWLVHLPRYFKGARLRLEKLRAGKGPADERALFTLEPWLKSLAQRQKHLADHQLPLDEVDYFRWMVEEYRISLFAQELGTSLTVSEKRLQQQWQKVPQ